MMYLSGVTQSVNALKFCRDVDFMCFDILELQLLE